MAVTNKIWIFAGQSWCSGISGTLTDLQAPYVGNYLHNSRIWVTDKFEPLYSTDNNNQYPTANKNTGCTFEFYFKDVADFLGEDVYILKYGENGTALAAEAGNDWNTASSSELYDGLVAEIALIETWMNDRNKAFSWEGIIWMQGEADSAIEAQAQAYNTNLTALYNGLNTATSSTLKIYQYNIEQPPLGTRTYLADVNSDKAAFTASDTANRRLFDTNITEWQVDDKHPSIAAKKTLWDATILPLIKTDL